MSFALLKNLIFPRKAIQTQGDIFPVVEHGQQQFTEKPLPSTPISSDSSVDLEAQPHSYHCEHCRPNEDRTDEKGKWFGKFSVSARMISDAIIGLSDGLTVPFALTAGLSSLGDTHLVILGGLAELVAGAISMGLGGFIGAKSEADSYTATVEATRVQIQVSPSKTACQVHAVFQPYGLPASSIGAISKTLHESPEQLLDFLMRFHHQMPEPASSRPWICAATIAVGYFLGGFVPLIPYLCVQSDEVLLALWWSIGTMVIALFAFGWVKTGVVSGWHGSRNVWLCTKGALQMVVVGSAAAGAAVGIVRGINKGEYVGN